MNKPLEQQLEDFVYRYHINYAHLYPKDYITPVGGSSFADEIKYDFIVKSLNSKGKETVKIGITNDHLSSVYCSCDDYQTIRSCEHIPAVIIHFQDKLVKTKKINQAKEISLKILDLFSQNKGQGNIKQKINTEYIFTFYENYWSKVCALKIKLGTDKLYSVSSKYNKFINAYYDNEGEVEFSKYFTYNPQKYYFSEEDSKILDFLHDNVDYRYGEIRISDNDLPRFLKLFTEKDFYIENIGLIKGIKEDVPFKITLSQEKDDYLLNVNYKDIIPLTNNLEYILYEKELYHLNKDYRKLLESLMEDEIDTLVFNKKELVKFSQGILPIVKKDLQVSEELEGLDILAKPEAKLYFDLNQSDVTCKLMFVYNNEEVNYFAQDVAVLKDVEYEKEVVTDLENLDFKIENNKILLDDLEKIVYFLEVGLEQLTAKYQVYTSEKLKGTSIRKKVGLVSNFAIGKDNILTYDFKMNDIPEEELFSLLASLKQKKKYHKLKSGDIVSLEDESLMEVNNLITDLDIDLKESQGIIPKYKAIYLDSLKKTKYHDIKTNNLFDEFIHKFLEYQNNTLVFSEKEKSILRAYQQTGVEWLYNIHKCDLGGILADEMGLGKSIQTIYFFQRLLEENKEAKFLIVCPTALIYNWVNEFLKFAPKIKVEILIGMKRQRHNLLRNSKASVYITSYGTLREDIELYEEQQFLVCVIDEAQNIKNPLAQISRATKRVHAQTKIALTGTPLENSVSEVWSIFDFIMPGFLSSLTKFQQKYKFKEIDEEATRQLQNLSKLIAPFILRRKKSEVAKELPAKIENNIYIDLTEEQKKLYALEIKKVEAEVDGLIEANGFNKSKLHILQLLTRLRQLCIDPSLIYENYKGESAKMENLIKVIEEVIANGHKILLFTSFKSALEIVRSKLNKKKITHYTIDGSVDSKTRAELVDKFNHDDTNVFLITLKSGGTGLNLTSADVVIHLDLWWNPQVENQATDRAHRIGQTKNVEVIKLIASGTIEEKILNLQKKKQTLSDKLIEKEDYNNLELADLTEKDLRQLLEFDNF